MYMKTKDIIWVSNPSYIIGDYKIVIIDSISVELHQSLQALVVSALDVRKGNKEETCKYLLGFIAFNLLLPVRVLVFVD